MNIRDFILTAFLGVIATGCGAVLTETQLATVHEFGTVSSDYPRLAPQVIEEYAKARAARVVLGVAVQRITRGAGTAETAIDALDKSVSIPMLFHERSAQIDNALAILSTYSDLLQKMTSDDFSSTLDETAIQFGDTIDSATKKYNFTFNRKLPSVGGPVGAVVRGAAGLYVRAKQAELLRVYVRAANPLVTSLTTDVISIVTPYSSSATELTESAIAAEKREIRQTYVADSLVHPDAQLPYEHILAFHALLCQLADVQGMADRIIAASKSYSQAHQRLVLALQSKAELKNGIEEIRALAGQIKSAAAVKEKIAQSNR